MKINLALERVAEVHWRCRRRQQLQGTPAASSSRPSIDYMQTRLRGRATGKPAEYPFMNIHTQSAVDPTVAPGGKHTISIFTQYFPYTLAEGTWDERREEIA